MKSSECAAKSTTTLILNDLRNVVYPLEIPRFTNLPALSLPPAGLRIVWSVFRPSSLKRTAASLLTSFFSSLVSLPSLENISKLSESQVN